MTTSDTVQDIYLLSPAQQGLLFHGLYAPTSGVYIEQLSFLIRGKIEIEIFEQSWKELVNRHSIFRTAFIWNKTSKLVQVVYRAVNLPIIKLDWREYQEDQQTDLLSDYLEKDRKRAFELSEAPLMRLTSIHVGDNAYRCILSYHHILLDGWSLAVAIGELFVLYDALCCGEVAPLPPAHPYRDYIAWLRRQDLGKAERYWRERLQGFTTPDRLAIEPSDDIGGEAGVGEHLLVLPLELTQDLQQLSQSQGLTLNTVVQGAWGLLLNRYSGENDIVFGTVVSGRPADLAGVEHMVGLFINTLPVRLRIPLGGTVLPWLKKVQAQLSELRQYEYSPLAQIQSWSDLPPGTPLFESLLAFENYPLDAAARSTVSSIEIVDIQVKEQTNYPLTLLAIPGPQLSFKLIFDRARFGAAAISRMLRHLQTLLTAISAAPNQPIADLALLAADEQRQLLLTWNDTAQPYPRECCLHQLFEQQVACSPDAVAVIFDRGQGSGVRGQGTSDWGLATGDWEQGNSQSPIPNPQSLALSPQSSVLSPQSLTYAQLNTSANRLAHRLQQIGVGPEVPVGLFMARSFDAVVAVLAILKAGGAYVPLDPDYPNTRLAFMVADARTPVVLTLRQYRDNLQAICAAMPDRTSSTIICLDDRQEIDSASPTTNPTSSVMPDSPAYLIYTSGSTGAPKGAIGLHRGAVNRQLWMLRSIPYGFKEVGCQKTALSFLDSLGELFGPLVQGRPCVIIPEPVVKDPELLINTLKTHAVTRLVLVPSLLRVLLSIYPDLAYLLPQLRVCITSGEALPPDLAATFGRCMPHCTLLNLYGSSEVSADVTWARLDDHAENAMVPIGRPIANSQVYVLDGALRPLPVGLAGELYVGGEGLARGYWRRPDLTAERFVPNPFGTMNDEGRTMKDTEDDSSFIVSRSSFGTRLYKTGDLARWSSAGQLCYLGRLDHQAKVRGFRIELGEIENVLLQHPDVQECIVLAREDRAGNNQLVAYLVMRTEGRGLSGADSSVLSPQSSVLTELRAFLKDKLPDYMVPATFVLLKALPLAPNGKIDLQALPDPQVRVSEYQAPTNDVERELIAIWEGVLEVDNIGVNNGFLELGGNSLKAMSLLSKMNRAGFRVALSDIYHYQTIKDLSRHILSSKKNNQSIHTKEELLTYLQNNNTAFELRSYHVRDSDEQIHVLYGDFPREDRFKISKNLTRRLMSNTDKDILPHYILSKIDMLTDQDQRIDPQDFTPLLGNYFHKNATDIEIELEKDYKHNDTWVKQGVVLKEYPLSPMQELQISFRTPASTGSFSIEEYIDYDILKKAYGEVIKRQGLLRSIAVKKDDRFYWREYDYNNDDIPILSVIDLTKYKFTPESADQLYKKVTQKIFEIGDIYYQIVILQRNLRMHHVILLFNHVIYDRVTAETIKRQLLTYYHTLLKGQEIIDGKEKETYESYVRQVRKGPQDVTEQEVIKQFHLEDFFESKQKLKSMLDSIKASDITYTFLIQVPFRGELKKKQDIEVALSIYGRVLQKYTGLDKIPLLFVFDGRMYCNKMYYNVVGECIDMVPMLIDPSLPPNVLLRSVQRRLDYLKQHNLNFLTLRLDREFSQTWQQVLTLMDFGENFENIDVMMYNFLGNVAEQDFYFDDSRVFEERNPLPIDTLFNCIAINHKDGLSFRIRCTYRMNLHSLQDIFNQVTQNLYC